MTSRLLITILVGFAIIGSARAQWGERERAPTPVQIPVEELQTLADLTLPDFKMLKMTATDLGGRLLIIVWVENTGGNKGLLEEPGPLDESPKRAAGMKMALSILECGSRDYGSRVASDFECVDPRSRPRSRGMVMPLAGQSRRTRHLIDHLRNPWQVWVMVEATLYADDEPVLEKDSPQRLNNQALLKIVYDPERSSYSYEGGQTWTWPNDEDTLPL